MKQILLTGAALLLASSAAFAATPADSDRAAMNTNAAPPASARANTANLNAANTVNQNGSARAGMMADSTDMFATVPSQEDLSSKVVGLSVYNNANQDIGTIKDIAFDRSGVQAYIVAVGGFLGMGDHYVAVKPSAINLTYDANAKKWHAAMNTNADQLKAAPEYKYSSNG